MTCAVNNVIHSVNSKGKERCKHMQASKCQERLRDMRCVYS